MNRPRGDRESHTKMKIAAFLVLEVAVGGHFLGPVLLRPSLGRFDEQFSPAWFEDVDFCRRLAAQGKSIWVVPADGSAPPRAVMLPMLGRRRPMRSALVAPPRHAVALSAA